MKKIANFCFLLFVLIGFGSFAQLTNTAKWGWAKNVGGTTVDIVSDSTGTVYILGNYSTDLAIEGQTLIGSGSYIAKYDSTSKFLSLKSIASSTSTLISLSLDPFGNLYACGSFTGTVKSGAYTLTSKGEADGMYVKLDASLNVLKAVQLGDINKDVISSIQVDKFGNLYALFEQIVSSYKSIKINKYNLQGDLKWSILTHNFNYYTTSEINPGCATFSLDNYGFVYVTSYGKDRNGTIVLLTHKLDDEGNFVWQKGFGPVQYEKRITQKTDIAGNTYILYSLDKDIKIKKIDASGRLVWEKTAGGPDQDYSENIVLDKLGNCYITGRIQQKVNFSTIEVNNPNSGLSDAFVAKYNSLGDVEWVLNAGNAGIDFGHGIGVDKNNNCYFLGSYTSNINFGKTRLSTGLTSSFVAKINQNYIDSLSIFTQPLTKLTYIAGTGIDVPFKTSVDFKPGTVFTVELSDPSGGFFYPTQIGTGTKSPISAVIPPLSILSAKYRVRVVAYSENSIGNDNGSDIAINTAGLQITPNWDWSKEVKGTTLLTVTDKLNNVYLVGAYENSIQLGGSQLNGTGNFIAKYNATSKLTWLKPLTNGKTDISTLVVDNEGNILFTGSFSSSITLGSTNLISKGKKDVYVAKFDKDGNFVFVKQYGALDDEEVYKSVSVDLDQNIVFVYNDKKDATRDSRKIVQIVKLSSTGSELWNKQFISFTGIHYPYAISQDQYSNIYFFQNIANLSSSIQDFSFFRKLDPSGNQVWIKPVVSATNLMFGNYDLSLKTDLDGNSVLLYSSVVSNSSYLNFVKYDATGQVVWTKSILGDKQNPSKDLALEPNGNIYITGRFQHTVNFGGIDISNFNSGVSDVFVAKYDKDGTSVWVKQAGETGIDEPSSVAVDENGNCYVTGTFTKTITFDKDRYSTPTTSSFFAKVGSTYTTAVGKASLISQSQICSGNVFKVQYAIKGMFKEGNEFIAQLSDKNGSFAQPLKIGSIGTALNNTIYSIIPDVADGTGYRIRVVSTQPALIGEDNGYNISINLANCKAAPPVTIDVPLVGVDYFYDSEDNKHTYIDLPRTTNYSNIQKFETAGLTPGFHNLFVRFKDSLNRWSLYEGRAIYIQPVKVELKTTKIKALEYFYDQDNGLGTGTLITNFKNSDDLKMTSALSTKNLEPGFHNLFVRFKDSLNNWSMYEGRTIYIQPVSKLTKPSRIFAAEYFIDEDPGIGSAQKILAFQPSDSISILRSLSTSNLTPGFHQLSVRVKDSLNYWSVLATKVFFVDATKNIGTESTKIIAAEYFINSDPGIGNATPLNGIIAGASVTIAPKITPPSVTSKENNLFLRVKNELGVWSHYEGRRFIVCNDVMPKPQITSISSVCAGSTITLSGKAVTGAVTYLWKGPNNFTATGLTASISNSDLSHSGKYILYAVRNGGTSCDTSNSELTVTVMPIQRKSNPQTICKGGFYEINGKKYTVAGTYEDILKSKNGCDSIITTILKVNEPSAFKEVKHICQGESYKGYSTTGVYSKKLTNSVGCDSTYTLDLIVHAPIKKVENKTICTGETYKGQTKTGSYTFSFTTSYGCDSTEQLNLTVRTKDTTVFSKSICKGQTYEGKSTSGVYYLNKKSVYGCDSIVKLTLKVNNPSSSSETKHICEGASYKGYTKSGTYTQKLVNKLGCDSVYTLQLIVHAPVKKVEKKTVCYGSTYKGQTKTGTYYFNYKTSYGCDSIEQLDLEVLTRDTTVLTKTICKGEKYDGYGEAGSYIYKKKNSLGCDSVVSLTLNVRALPKVSLTFRETLCSNTGVFQLDSLNAGIPKGGIFTGDHVQEENIFDPKGLSGAVALTYTYTDDFGCASSITKSVQLSEANGTASCKVGAINEKVNSAFSIYPNPTNDVVSIKVSADLSILNYTVTITDVVGKQLQTTKLLHTQTDISLRNLGAVGVYMVNIFDTNGQFITCQRVVLTD
jgi:hypothetical protein